MKDLNNEENNENKEKEATVMKKTKSFSVIVGIIFLIIGVVTLFSFAVRGDPLYWLFGSVIFIVFGVLLMAFAFD